MILKRPRILSPHNIVFFHLSIFPFYFLLESSNFPSGEKRVTDSPEASSNSQNSPSSKTTSKVDPDSVTAEYPALNSNSVGSRPLR